MFICYITKNKSLHLIGGEWYLKTKRTWVHLRASADVLVVFNDSNRTCLFMSKEAVVTMRKQCAERRKDYPTPPAILVCGLDGKPIAERECCVLCGENVQEGERGEIRVPGGVSCRSLYCAWALSVLCSDYRKFTNSVYATLLAELSPPLPSSSRPSRPDSPLPSTSASRAA